MSSRPVADLLARLPEGWSAVLYRGRRWGVSRTRLAGGRIEKLYAEELGGRGVISANLYLPGGTAREGDERLRPCEMPAADVLAFLREWLPSGLVSPDHGCAEARPRRDRGGGPRGGGTVLS